MIKFKQAHRYTIVIKSPDESEHYTNVMPGKASLISNLLQGNNFNHIRIIGENGSQTPKKVKFKEIVKKWLPHLTEVKR